jgi:hypothetical protein
MPDNLPEVVLSHADMTSLTLEQIRERLYCAYGWEEGIADGLDTDRAQGFRWELEETNTILKRQFKDAEAELQRRHAEACFLLYIEDDKEVFRGVRDGA